MIPRITERAAALTRWWVRLYTEGMPADLRDSRRAEIDSDLWEHQQHAFSVGCGPLETGLQILGRLLLGMPDDWSWRLTDDQVRRAERGQRSAIMTAARRLAGPAAILGGALWLALPWFPDARSSPPAPVILALATIQLILLLVTLVGVYALGRLRRAGKVGLLVALAGSILMTSALALLRLPNAAGWAWFIGVLVLNGGWLVFALTNLSSRALSRWNGLPLTIALVPVLISVFHDLLRIGWVLPIGIVLLGLCWIGLGYTLWQGTGQAAPEPRLAR